MNAYLFDLDGTLIDSMPTFTTIMLRYLKKHNVKYESDVIKTITPLGYKGTAEYFKLLGIDLPVNDIMVQLIQDIKNEYENNIPSKNNVVSVLNQLKNRGDRLNVLTASPHEMLDPCLTRLGLYDLFDNVWSCDDFNLKKSDTQIYIQAAQRIGTDVKSITFLDDNLLALKTAKKAGMRIFGVYDQSSEEYSIEIKEISEKYIMDFSSLL